jgi:TetR/AcrR family transcriptional regulator, cholesterol catabolism regulator
VIDSLEMLYSGALVRAGMGYASNTEIAQRLEKSARLILS